MTYEKTHSILDLAIWMQSNREGISLQDIMENFSVSRRTAERMRDTILDKFPQTKEIVGENKVKRWYIPQGTLRNFIQFSAEELSCMEKTVKFLKINNMLEHSKILQNILEKIRANIIDSEFRRIDSDLEVLLDAEGFTYRVSPNIVIPQDIIQKIRYAIMSCKQISIVYKNKSTGNISNYQLLPYGILYGECNHYLLAKHSDGYDNDKVHNYILSNITEIEVLEDSYKMDEDFNINKYTERSFGVFQEEPFEVEWLFDKSVADEVKRYKFHPNQTITENQDGSVTVKFFSGGRLEMDWHLYTWGDNVQVIKPEDWYTE